MRKLQIVLFTFFGTYILSAQVGIGTTNPQAALDITATTDGLLVPRVALFNTVTPTIDTPTQSELVYNTATSGIAPNNVTPGFYYWNGTSWIRLIVPTDNAANVTGTVAVANGGTGLSALGSGVATF